MLPWTCNCYILYLSWRFKNVFGRFYVNIWNYRYKRTITFLVSHVEIQISIVDMWLAYFRYQYSVWEFNMSATPVVGGSIGHKSLCRWNMDHISNSEMVSAILDAIFWWISSSSKGLEHYDWQLSSAYDWTSVSVTSTHICNILASFRTVGTVICLV